jgi:hypothetical protein
VDTYCLAQLCKSWLVPDGSDGIRFFTALSSVYGRFDCDNKRRLYRAMTNFKDAEHHEDFKNLFNDAQSKEKAFLDGQIPRMRGALFNLLSMITVTSSMRCILLPRRIVPFRLDPYGLH